MTEDFEPGALLRLGQEIERHKNEIEELERQLKSARDPTERTKIDREIDRQLEELNRKAAQRLEGIRALREGGLEKAHGAAGGGQRPPPARTSSSGTDLPSRGRDGKIPPSRQAVNERRENASRRPWVPIRRIAPNNLPPPGAFLLLAWLSFQAWSQPRGRPKQTVTRSCRTFAGELGVSEKSVRRWLKWLQEHGFISRETTRVRTDRGILPQRIVLRRPRLIGTAPGFSKVSVREVEEMFRAVRSRSWRRADFKEEWLERAWE